MNAGPPAPVSPRANENLNDVNSKSQSNIDAGSTSNRMTKTSFIEFTQRMHDDNMPDDLTELIAEDMWEHMIMGCSSSRKRRKKRNLTLSDSIGNGNDSIVSDVSGSVGTYQQWEEEYVTRKEFNNYLSSMDLFQLLTINF